MADDLEAILEDTSVAASLDIENVETQKPLSYYLDKISRVLIRLQLKSRTKVEALVVYRLYLEQNVSNPDLVLKTLARISGKKESVIRYGPKFSSITSLRKVAYHAIRYLGVSSTNTGKYFFRKDHSTVLSSVKDVDLDIIKFKKLVNAAVSETELNENELEMLINDYKETRQQLVRPTGKNRDYKLILQRLDSETAGKDIRTDALVKALVTYSLLLEHRGLSTRNLKATATKIGSLLFDIPIFIRDIDEKRRKPYLSSLRAVVCRAYRELGLSYPEIGKKIQKDHSSAITACRKIDSAFEMYNDLVDRILDGTEITGEPRTLSNEENLDQRLLSQRTGRTIDTKLCNDRIYYILAGMGRRESELVKALVVYRALLEEGGVDARNLLKRISEKSPADTSPSSLISDDRDSFTVANRYVASYILKELGLSYSMIALKTKRREHSQVVNGVQKIGAALKYYEALLDAAFSDKDLTTEDYNRFNAKYWKEKTPK